MARDRISLHATDPRNLAAPRVIATRVHRLSATFLRLTNRIPFAIEIKKSLVPTWLRTGRRLAAPTSPAACPSRATPCRRVCGRFAEAEPARHSRLLEAKVAQYRLHGLEPRPNEPRDRLASRPLDRTKRPTAASFVNWPADAGCAPGGPPVRGAWPPANANVWPNARPLSAPPLRRVLPARLDVPVPASGVLPRPFPCRVAGGSGSPGACGRRSVMRKQRPGRTENAVMRSPGLGMGGHVLPYRGLVTKTPLGSGFPWPRSIGLPGAPLFQPGVPCIPPLSCGPP